MLKTVFLVLTIIVTSVAVSAQASLTIDAFELTETEREVQRIIDQDGIHVVRFWNPRCGNSLSELQNGLYEVVASNPNVTFTFVTIWNDDVAGQDILDLYLIPERVTVLVQPDNGPSEHRSNRRYAFLGIPVTWTPSTRIYHRNGVLAYAFNYGELNPQAFQQAIYNTRNEWTHD